MDAHRDRLIVALDVDSISKALETCAALRGVVSFFKIGSQLFTAAGPQVVKELLATGARVFLDLKFHDIPNTVAGAAIEATRLGVSLFNLHALGGSEMMRRTIQAVGDVSDREGLTKPAVIAVTVLTSADSRTLSDIGIPSGVDEQVARLAGLTAACGLDGVVASAREVALVRSAVPRREFLIVTPGVRPGGTSHADQKRVMTPAEAIRAGADYIVIGRPILDAPNPALAADAIQEEINRTLPSS
jgi:orotidine-5'-phosphate decarboxylase